MVNKEINEEEIFTELVEQALEGKHTSFEFIKNFDQFLFAIGCWKDRKNLVKLFKQLEKEFIKEYVEQIKTSEQDFNLIASIKQVATVKEYYKEEAAILAEMIKEYKAYVLNGHIVSTIVGIDRREEDLYDFRFF